MESGTDNQGKIHRRKKKDETDAGEKQREKKIEEEEELKRLKKEADVWKFINKRKKKSGWKTRSRRTFYESINGNKRK